MPHPSQEDNDVDEFEDDEEIGEDEDIEDYIPQQGNMIGEVLLIHNYSLSQLEAQQEMTRIRSIYSNQQRPQQSEKRQPPQTPKDLFTRPTTP